MPRRPRQCPPGYVYHVLNRGVGRMTLFEDDGDYEAFERVLMRTRERVPGVELFAYCLMPNHWHLLVRPKRAGELSEFMRLLTVTHSQRWHAHRRSAGTGPIYQGRFKSFPVQAEGHFLTVVRYVERNPLRAKLVAPGRAQDWRWSSLAVRRLRGRDRDAEAAERQAMLSAWPIPGAGLATNRFGEPRGWLRTVNRPQSAAELAALRTSVQRGRPFGDRAWVDKTAATLDLSATLRPRGRPSKQSRTSTRSRA